MKKIIFLSLLLISITVSFVYGQSAKDSYKALKRLEMSTNTTVSYRDYNRLLADAMTEVELFLETKEGKEDNNLSLYFMKAIMFYDKALTIWELKFSYKGTRDFIPFDSSEGEIIRKLYPKANIHRSTGNSSNSMQFSANQNYFIPEVLDDIWKDASKEVHKASNFLK